MEKMKYSKTERALMDLLNIREYSKRKYFFEEYTKRIIKETKDEFNSKPSGESKLMKLS